MSTLIETPIDVIRLLSSFLSTDMLILCHTVCKTFCAHMTITKFDEEFMARIIIDRFFTPKLPKEPVDLAHILTSTKFEFVTKIEIPYVIRISRFVYGTQYMTEPIPSFNEPSHLKYEHLLIGDQRSILSEDIYVRVTDACLFCSEGTVFGFRPYYTCPHPQREYVMYANSSITPMHSSRPVEIVGGKSTLRINEHEHKLTRIFPILH
jgi:hypothetical protein